MKKIRIEFRASQDERNKIEEIAGSYDLTISDYIRRKLLDDNDDIEMAEDRYFSPAIAKHNLFTVTALYKIISMFNELLKKQGLNDDDLLELEKKSLEYAREARARYGYQIIRSEKVE
jgi:hypothetical protein